VLFLRVLEVKEFDISCPGKDSPLPLRALIDPDERETPLLLLVGSLLLFLLVDGPSLSKLKRSSKLSFMLLFVG